MINKTDKIFITGHNGMVGKSLTFLLKKKNYKNILTISKKKLDLTNQKSVNNYFKKNKINCVIVCAAKVGGIFANDNFPADFIYENLMIESNLIHCSHINKVKRLIFLGSTCIYPKLSKQPIKEDSMLSGYLEKTNEPYAVAKIAGIKLCESYNRQYGTDFRVAIPCNLYGPNDNFNKMNAHVIPAMIAKIYEASQKNDQHITLWGSGKPLREFLYVDDLSEGLIHLMNMSKKKYHEAVHAQSIHINIGKGDQISIKKLANIIAKELGYNGKIVFDKSYPDGTLKKLSDTTLINKLGWSSSIGLAEGISKTVNWYRENYVKTRK